MVDYKKIYEYLESRRPHKYTVVSASGIAHAIGVDRIYGATMLKLVREGQIEPMPQKGFYKII